MSTRELRNQLTVVLGRVMYAGEWIGVTRNSKLAAVVVSVADLEALDAFELAQDVSAHRDAVAADDGQRVSLPRCGATFRCEIPGRLHHRGDAAREEAATSGTGSSA